MIEDKRRISNREMDNIEALGKVNNDLTSLSRDMEKFAGIYTEDPTCWQGEAAQEELCYITADIDEFRKQAEELKTKIDALTDE